MWADVGKVEDIITSTGTGHETEHENIWEKAHDIGSSDTRIGCT